MRIKSKHFQTRPNQTKPDCNAVPQIKKKEKKKAYTETASQI